ncbi:MAG: hypothetical protein K6T80_00575 [Firmicutes bacterium]|nr:hypothetical protein [Bacillota bacterium]
MSRVRREQENYISSLDGINRSKKSSAKEAILWLLGRGPHTEDEIAEHFGLPGEIVSQIAGELIKAKRVVRQPGVKGMLALRDPFKNLTGR